MMMRSEHCTLPEQLDLLDPVSEWSLLPASACRLLYLLRCDRVPAEYKHRMKQIRPLLRIERSHQPQRRLTRSQRQSTPMPVSSSLGSLSAFIFVRHVFTRCHRGGDSVILSGRNYRLRTYLTTGARLALFSLFVVTAFPTFAFSSTRQVSPTRTEVSEVSIVQLPSGTKLRFVRRPQAVAAPHSHSETPSAALKKMAEDAATAHTLPVNYFLRLIRQESGFDPNSVSPAGAQGIAQFMPTTASNRGLKDPFDPAEALPKSAELLSELKDHFGNLGLAAAAYNAGPERIRKWLAGESPLPQETINYVRVITGHDVTDWAKSNNLTVDLSADAIGPSHAHYNRLSWEAQLLATLRATSADGAASSATTVSSVNLVKTSLKMGETSLLTLHRAIGLLECVGAVWSRARLQ